MMNYPKKLFRSLESQMFRPLFTAFYIKNEASFSFLRELKPCWTFQVFGREPPTVRDQHQTSGAVGHLSQVLVPFVTSQRTDFQQCMVCHQCMVCNQNKYTNYAYTYIPYRYKYMHRSRVLLLASYLVPLVFKEA